MPSSISSGRASRVTVPSDTFPRVNEVQPPTWRETLIGAIRHEYTLPALSVAGFFTGVYFFIRYINYTSVTSSITTLPPSSPPIKLTRNSNPGGGRDGGISDIAENLKRGYKKFGGSADQLTEVKEEASFLRRLVEAGTYTKKDAQKIMEFYLNRLSPSELATIKNDQEIQIKLDLTSDKKRTQSDHEKHQDKEIAELASQLLGYKQGI